MKHFIAVVVLTALMGCGSSDEKSTPSSPSNPGTSPGAQSGGTCSDNLTTEVNQLQKDMDAKLQLAETAAMSGNVHEVVAKTFEAADICDAFVKKYGSTYHCKTSDGGSFEMSRVQSLCTQTRDTGERIRQRHGA